MPSIIDQSCAVCLNNFSGRDKIKELIICKHCFHERCIDSWLRRAIECPLCKRSAIADELLLVRNGAI